MIGRPQNGDRIATCQPNEVLIKVPIRLFERVGFHRTARAFSAPLKGGPRRLRAVEDFGSDPSRVPARIYICLRVSVTTLLEGLSAGALFTVLAGGLTPAVAELQSHEGRPRSGGLERQPRG